MRMTPERPRIHLPDVDDLYDLFDIGAEYRPSCNMQVPVGGSLWEMTSFLDAKLWIVGTHNHHLS